MVKTKAQKEKIIEELKEKIARQKAMVFADFSGLKVKDLVNLRKKMKEKDCELKIAKKTLIQIVFKAKEMKIDEGKLQGEIALGFGYKDEISPFKILYDFSRKNENLKILGGIIGKEILEKEKAIELAQLPTKDELLAKLVGSISAPILNFLNILQGNIKGLIYLLTKVKA